MSNDDMEIVGLSYKEINEDNKFDLSIWRSSDQRIKMVQDPDCPREVLDVVIDHDLDDDVVFATLLAKQIDDELLDKLCKRYNCTRENLDRRRDNMNKMKEDIRAKVFCGVPWNHVSTNASGTIRMCCQMINSQGYEGEENYGTVFKEDGTALTTSDDLSQHRNAPAWKKIRKELLDGEKPEICKLCWDEEANGIGSRREWTNNVFYDLFDKAILKTEEDGSIKHEDFPIEHWDLRFGNKCNLACRSCGPTDSDLWYKDWVAMQGRNTFYNRGIGEVTIDIDESGKATVKDSPFEWFDKTDLVSNVKESMPEIKRFYFTGGEPTINHTHRKLLQFAIDEDYAKDIVLDYNTNMAGVPNAIFEQWKKFKEVNLGMSIDGIYEHFEYIRHPGKWKTAYNNMTRIDNNEFTNLQASVTMTVSIMNVLHLLDMQWWMREQNWNTIAHSIIVHNLYGPTHLNTQNLPKSMKNYITERYNKFLEDIQKQWPDDAGFLNLVEQRLSSILHHMHAVDDNPDEWKSFFYHTEKLDKIRGENWKESLPEIEQMIRYCIAKDSRKNDVKLATAGKK